MTEKDDAVRREGRHVIVTLPAEIDVTNSAEVDELLGELASQHIDIMTVDMTGTNFCDTSGIHALARAHRVVTANGGELRIATGGSPARRVLELTGLDQVVRVYEDLTQALNAPREQAQHA